METDCSSVLLIGSGGREHAIASHIRSFNPDVTIYAAPGNAGIASVAQCINIAATSLTALYQFANKNKVSLTIVGGEVPLAMGIVNTFRSNGLLIFGPTRECALVESSKSYARQLMTWLKIPSPKYMTFTGIREALTFVDFVGDKPLVIKSDKLAGGKGVFVTKTQQEARDVINSLEVLGLFNELGEKFLIEECLVGREVSFFVMTEGKNVLNLGMAQDYKRLKDNDEGPNTGGMGAVSNDTLLSPELQNEVIERIVSPLLKYFRETNSPYTGILYVGLMIVDEKPYVLEFNARLGDPETQALMPRITENLLPHMYACAGAAVWSAYGGWNGYDIWKPPTNILTPEPSMCVVLASGQYPMFPTIVGGRIRGLRRDGTRDDVHVYHNGTSLSVPAGEYYKVDGGRILTLSAVGNNARNTIYKAAAGIQFDDMQFRTDIGK